MVCAGKYHPRTVVGHRGHDGGEPFRLTVVDGAKPGHGLGIDAAGVDRAGRILVWGFNVF
jgi:hypothetical protein